MKTTKFSTNKKIMASASMLLVSAFMLSSATYAWFTMNKTVTVNGMEVKTKVGSNLLICDDNIEANYKADNLLQSRKALLEPVSTVNGTTGSFFYTIDAAADGSKAHDTTTSPYASYAETTTAPDAATSFKANCDTTFNSTYGITSPASTAFGTAYGYIDYVFYLKGTSDEANQQIVMSECNLIYMGSNDDTATALGTGDKAWRVAVFADDITSEGGDGLVTADPAANSNTAKAILTLDSAALFDSTAVASTTTKSAVTYNTWDPNNIHKFTAPGQTAYKKVTVRLWLEGEDTTCTSETYAALSNRYKLNLKFDIVGSSAVESTNVDNIGTNASSTGIAADPTPAQGG